jgi:hypothetical protein
MRKIDYTNRGNCKDYEKPWKNYCVDKGLDDVWLEKLNSLGNFLLINICEGHEKRRGVGEKEPHIYLRLNYSNDNILDGGSIQPFIQQTRALLLNHFPMEFFDANLDIDFRVSTKTGLERLSDCTINIEVAEKFLERMKENKNQWFEIAIKNIVDFDSEWGNVMSKYLLVWN